jgi:Flp pilus assembly protein TadG
VINVKPANSHPGKARRASFRSGQSTAELALVLPVLVMLLLIGTDLARVFYLSIGVNGAARAGAEYGSQSVITAADSPGMVAAAQADGSSLASLNVTATQCTCMSSATVAACPASYCANNAQATYVTVTAQAPFHTVVTYPGLPSSLTLSGKAIMPVQR